MRLFLLLICFVVCSCSHYQYLKIASDEIPLNEKNEFVAENDTIRIVYNFYGKNAPLKLSIFNKTNKALLVDWTRTVLITGETAVSFHDPNVPINGQLSGSLSTLTPTSINGTLSATANVKEGTQFLPPSSGVTRSGIYLKLPKEVTALKKELVKDGEHLDQRKLAKWQKKDSPLTFRIYLSARLEDQGNFTWIVSDREFYLAEFTDTTRDPGAMLKEGSDGNVGYFKYFTRSGAMLRTVGGLAALGAVIYVAAQ